MHAYQPTHEPMSSSTLVDALSDRYTLSDACEFCDTRPIAWKISMTPFRFGRLLIDEAGVCQECKDLAEAGDWDEIVARFPIDGVERELAEGYRENATWPATMIPRA